MTESNAKATITVSMAYATPKEQIWHELDVAAGSTLRDVIVRSGILSEFPKIDLTKNKVGVFGKIVDVDSVVRDGDRVEIYRPITIDPELLEKRKYKLRKMKPTIETNGNVRQLEISDRKQTQQEEDTMSLAGLLSEYGFVVKVDVTDLDQSLKWYQDNLGFRLDDRYSAGSWRQLIIDELPNTAIGLYLNPDGAGLGGKKATFVVTDIEAVRNILVRSGVEVDEIVELGDWVKLAFLRDPDGNVFGIRENIDLAVDETA